MYCIQLHEKKSADFFLTTDTIMEVRAMETKIRIIPAVLVCLLCIIGSASAQTYRIEEGRQLMEFSRYVIDQGQLMETCACTDKAALLKQGGDLVKKGNDVLAKTMMMKTKQGRLANGELGKKIMAAGSLLTSKGKQAGPLTGKDKEEVNTFGRDMVAFGNLKLQQAKVMCGE
jgi:hypothetical protein